MFTEGLVKATTEKTVESLEKKPNIEINSSSLEKEIQSPNIEKNSEGKSEGIEKEKIENDNELNTRNLSLIHISEPTRRTQ